jgi:hypothetical protein
MWSILRWVRQWLFRPSARGAPPPVPQPPPLPAPEPVAAAPDPAIVEISRNRHERRALERARRRHDKFVTPLNKPAPVERTRQPRPPRIKKVEVITEDIKVVDDAELDLHDTHHENRNELVMYKEAEMYGEFNFRDTILQQLERYFVYIERMKKRDPEGYGFYREVGANILPYASTGSWHRGRDAPKKDKPVLPPVQLSSWFNQTRPAFGCYIYGADPETEKFEQGYDDKKHRMWVPKMMYFKKYKNPPALMQPMSGGDIYSMTVYWDRPDLKKNKHGVPQEFGIFVSTDGKQVIALRQLCHDRKYIQPKRRLGSFSIPDHHWRIPTDFEQWARDNGEDAPSFLTNMFLEAVQHVEGTQLSMARVTATNDAGVAAIFSVNIHRSSYFFADRDYSLVGDGKRKRIFHFVRPHVRADGSTVKAHFRGEREFTWAGYRVNIHVPGRDHLIIDDFDAGVVDEEWQEKDKKYIDMAEMGRRLRGYVEGGVGAKHG